MTDDGIIDHVAIQLVLEGHAPYTILTPSEKTEAMAAAAGRGWSSRDLTDVFHISGSKARALKAAVK